MLTTLKSYGFLCMSAIAATDAIFAERLPATQPPTAGYTQNELPISRALSSANDANDCRPRTLGRKKRKSN